LFLGGLAESNAEKSLHPAIMLIRKRLEAKSKVHALREWELEQIENCLSSLPTDLQANVRVALERCRLVQFGLPNYLRWMASDAKIELSEEELIRLQEQLQRDGTQILDRLKTEVAEFDRKFLQRLPAEARQKFQRRLGFPIEQLPNWGKSMPWHAYAALWLPFEQTGQHSAEAYSRLRYRLDPKVEFGAPVPFSSQFMERVPLSEVIREYGMARFSPAQIETAIREHIDQIRSYASSIANDDAKTRAAVLAGIDLMDQWVRGEPIDELDDWDRMYRATTDYQATFLHIGELEDVRGRTPAKHLVDYPGPASRHLYQMLSIHRWMGLPGGSDGSFKDELDLTQSQKLRLNQFWYKKHNASKLNWEAQLALFPELKAELESVLTPQQSVIGFQCVVAGSGPFRILMHPDAAKDYDLSPDDRIALKSFAQQERKRIEQARLEGVRRSYQTAISSLAPAVQRELFAQIEFDLRTLAAVLAECNVRVDAKRFPHRYYWFDEFYDTGRVSAPLEDVKGRSRKTLMKYGWKD
jgi:hypothetical protein